MIGGNVGTGDVISDDGTAITLALSLTEPAPLPFGVDLVLAVPRPKALTRVIEMVASFGVPRIDLTNAWRVDKSYLRSPRLGVDALATAARLGAEQGATTLLPTITIHDRLMALVDARWPAPGNDLRLLAHPGGERIERVVRHSEPITLAIGPEGGWIEREVETFVARGFKPVSIGDRILRVESAVAAALGQLMMLDRLRQV